MTYRIDDIKIKRHDVRSSHIKLQYIYDTVTADSFLNARN